MHAFSECRPYRSLLGILRAIQFGLLDHQTQAEREKRGFALSPQALAMLVVKANCAGSGAGCSQRRKLG